MYKHTLKDGTKVSLEDLKKANLINIIENINQRCKGGITLTFGCSGFGYYDTFADVEELTEEQALRHYNYYEYLKELKKRNEREFRRASAAIFS